MRKYVYHYTSIQTLYHLLEARRLDGNNNDNIGKDVELKNQNHLSLPCKDLSFLATDISALNDRTEYAEITQLISNFKETKEIKFVDEVINGLAFVISFSYQADSLPMWLQYADSGRGICLRFDSQLLHDSLIKEEEQTPYEWLRMGKCNYSKSAEFKELYDKVKTTNQKGLNDKNLIENLIIFRDFSLQSAFLKDKAFVGEDEWRIVIYAKHFLFYPCKNGLVARTRINIPISTLTEIKLGPCATEVDKLYVKRLLELIETSPQTSINLSYSRLPYRTF